MENGLKRKKVLSRPIAISADYLGNEDKSDKRQELIRFFSPFSSGTLTVNHLGVEREIEYEVESFHFTSQNIYDVLEFEIELSCMVQCSRTLCRLERQFLHG